MPDDVAVATPASAVTPAAVPVSPAPTQTPEPKVGTPEEQEARRAARAANHTRQLQKIAKERENFGKERAAFTQEQNSWKQASQQALQNASKLWQLEKLAKDDPVKALEQLSGYKFEDVLKKTATRGTLTPESVQEMIERRAQEIAEATVGKYKNETEESAKKREIEQRKEYEANVERNIKSELASRIKAAPDKYEFVADAGTDGVAAAYRLMLEYYEKMAEAGAEEKDRFLSLDEALDNLEDSYFNIHWNRQSKSQKVKARLEAEAAKAKEEAEKAAAEKAAKASPSRWPRRAVPESKQDTNRLDQAASQAPTTPPQNRPMNIRERIAAHQQTFHRARTANDA
jgi:colicin import membrane protein